MLLLAYKISSITAAYFIISKKMPLALNIEKKDCFSIY